MINTSPKDQEPVAQTYSFISEAVVRNAHGIHCRPSAIIVKEARLYEDTLIRIEANGGHANPCSAIELLSLGLDRGTRVRICVEGPNGEACAAKLASLFERQYDFPSRT